MPKGREPWMKRILKNEELTQKEQTLTKGEQNSHKKEIAKGETKIAGAIEEERKTKNAYREDRERS